MRRVTECWMARATDGTMKIDWWVVRVDTIVSSWTVGNFGFDFGFGVAFVVGFSVVGVAVDVDVGTADADADADAGNAVGRQGTGSTSARTSQWSGETLEGDSDNGGATALFVFTQPLSKFTATAVTFLPSFTAAFTASTSAQALEAAAAGTTVAPGFTTGFTFTFATSTPSAFSFSALIRSASVAYLPCNAKKCRIANNAI
mmetsp:Transcript_11196/g.13665  ORF Transcript_11196/g.13665 Transcript_11196/m.13665 type:complete len:202 (-) Transcript_11196:27-632(-)